VVTALDQLPEFRSVDQVIEPGDPPDVRPALPEVAGADLLDRGEEGRNAASLIDPGPQLGAAIGIERASCTNPGLAGEAVPGLERLLLLPSLTIEIDDVRSLGFPIARCVRTRRVRYLSFFFF
jgi:hypothetical protein